MPAILVTADHTVLFLSSATPVPAMFSHNGGNHHYRKNPRSKDDDNDQDGIPDGLFTVDCCGKVLRRRHRSGHTRCGHSDGNGKEYESF